MGMALRGVTHCYRCHKPLADNEFYICNHCKKVEEEDKRKEGECNMMLPSDFNDIDEYIKNEKKKMTFKDDLKQIIKSVLIEIKDESQKQQKGEKCEIKRLGKLALGYKTFVGREANEDEIEICMWDSDFTHKWTIASFEYDKETNSYNLEGSCYLRDVQDWIAFGTLVKEGFEILDDFID